MSKLGTGGGLDCRRVDGFPPENGGERRDGGRLDRLERRRRTEQLT